jgi:hypothetical protein
MGVLHPIGRIGALSRGNLADVRQIESENLSVMADKSLVDHMNATAKPDPAFAQIAAQFMHHDVKKSAGGYSIIDRRTSNPVARLRPIPGTDRFELFYWSNVKGRWTTFGNMGRMKLMLQSAYEIVENEPLFRIAGTR